MAASVGSLASLTMRAEPAVSASGTGFRPSSISLRRHWPSACVWLSTRLMVLQRGARRRHQLMAHAQEVLADDVEIGVGQQVMDVGDAAGDRVLDRDHGEARFARLHRLQRVLERRAGDGFHGRGTPRGRRDANWRRARPGRRCASAAGLPQECRQRERWTWGLRDMIARGRQERGSSAIGSGRGRLAEGSGGP